MMVLSVIFYIVASIVKAKEEDAIDYRQLLFSYDNIEGEYTKLDITSAYSFAGKDNLTYYYVQDEDGYVYVARITDATFDRIDEAYQKCTDKDNFTYTIYGYVRGVYADLKKFIISEFDDAFDLDFKLNSSTYDDYFSDTYIDETLSGRVTLDAFFIGAGVIFDIVAIILLIVYFVSASRSKKSLKAFNYDILYAQLSAIDTVCYKKEGIYLTPQFVVSKSNGLRVLSYSDIIWMYNVKNRVNGVPTTVQLAAACKDKKIYTVAFTSVKNEDALVEIMSRIHARNDGILMGYTDENILYFREYKKSANQIN